MTKAWTLAVVLIVGCGASKAAKDAGAAIDGSVAETSGGGAGRQGGAGAGAGGGAGRESGEGGVGGVDGGQGGGGGARAGSSGTAGGAGSSGGSDGGLEAGGAGDDGGGSAACPGSVGRGSTMSWLEDGVRKCADNAVGMVRMNYGLTVTGTPSTSVCIACSLTVRVPAMSGSYVCTAYMPGVDAGASSTDFSFWSSNEPGTFTVNSCTVTITSDVTSGANVKGTFSAELRSPNGGTKVISGGVFDAFVL